MLRLSRSERYELWLGRLNRCAGSGQSVAEFCAGEGVSAAAFYQWKQRLAPSVAVPKRKRKIKPKIESSGSSAFTELRIPPIAPSMASVRLPRGITIELGTEPSTVAAIVGQVLTHSLGASQLIGGNGHDEARPC